MSRTNTISDIIVESYSEKALVVRGDIESHKEALMNLGGKYNDRLKGGEGWIFSKTKKGDIDNWIQSGTAVEGSRYRPTSSEVPSDRQDIQIKRLNTKIDRLEELLIKVLEILGEEEDNEEVVPVRRLLR